MATEDYFSFPTTTDTTSSAIDTPPLWRLSPAASPDFCHGTTKTEEEEEEEEDSDQDEDYQDCLPTHQPIKYSTQIKSCSWAERGGGAKLDDENEDKEEKMDMLWEDFNEELSIKRSPSSLRFDSDIHMVKMGCIHQIQSLRSSTKTTSTAMVSPKKPPAAAASLVVFIKVLKKLFLLHNSHTHLSVHRNHRSPIKRAENQSW
ncbi:uncharacterized protein LOC110606492 [Manihot esculenta]|uniref:Uncharacterized protein n=1 Tax=Manihot esculenta TaxID=3983 RepID=A0A2C9U203_MANES|nr:uncharacterized protein LOC110606492 [Manihot esculenta]OAY23703.1 hypothetical protein MANES_18G100400v8 [Manihot esculenta]